jgi:hypothetical protein
MTQLWRIPVQIPTTPGEAKFLLVYTITTQKIATTGIENSYNGFI